MTMIGQTTLSKPHVYKISEIPNFDIDYRGLTKLARQKGCSVAALSDSEKNQFIHGSTMAEVREKSIKLWISKRACELRKFFMRLFILIFILWTK